RPRPNSGVLRWLAGSDELTLHLSALTIGEMRIGVASLPPSKKRTLLDEWLEVRVRARFAGRILSVDEAIADRWGRFTAEARVAGRTIPAIDGLIAATALEHGLTLVTRNVRDISQVGVDVINPWEAR